MATAHVGAAATAAGASEDPRERVARVKRAHSLLPTILAEGVALRPGGGGRWLGRCPFHDDRTPSFVVYADEDRFHCFGGACGERGDIFDWLRLRRGLDFRAALDHLDAASPPPPPPARAPTPGARARGDDPGDPRWEALGYEEQLVMNCAGAFYHDRLLAAPAARRYLARRGIPPDLIASQRLGYADGTGFQEALGDERRRVVARRLGLLLPAAPSGPQAVGDGDQPSRGPWREALAGRIVIPELRGNQPIWFAGRLLAEDPPPGAGWRPPKYRNLRGARPILGYERVAGEREAFLVEGPFDYLTALAWGLAACCTCGTGFRLDRLGFLASAESVYGLFDGDAAGRAAIWRFAPVLGAVLRPLGLPDGLDLNALAARPDGRSYFDALLAAGRRGEFLRPPDDAQGGTG